MFKSVFCYFKNSSFRAWRGISLPNGIDFFKIIPLFDKNEIPRVAPAVAKTPWRAGGMTEKMAKPDPLAKITTIQ
jgi:hypothetical protein